jgi:hypothetical protein
VVEAALPPPIVELPVGFTPAWTAGEVAEGAPKKHSRVLAYSLIGVGAAAAVVAVIGWVEVSSYNGYAGSIAAGTPGAQALSRLSQANAWQDVAIVTSIGVGLAGGAVALTW